MYNQFMARLTEQRRVIQALYDYHKNVPLTDRNYMDRLVSASEGVVSRDELIDYCNLHKILISDDDSEDKIRKEYGDPNSQLPSQWALTRRSQIKTLIESCFDDKFIEPVIQELEVPDGSFSKKKKIIAEIGIRVTSKGTDLIHALGLLKTIVGKYQLLFGLFGGAAGIEIIRFILKLNNIDLP